MQYPIVVILSGPEKTRAKAELALEKARLTIIPPKEWPIQRESYRAEHWPHLTQLPSGQEPDEEHGFVAVLAETEAAFHAAYGVVEKAKWVLRVHHEMPEQPKPDPVAVLFDDLTRRLDNQQQTIAALSQKLGLPAPIGGAGFETGAGEFMQSGSYSAAQLRRSVFGWAARATSTIGSAVANTPGAISGGLFSAADMQLSAAGSGLVVNTSTGDCLIPGQEAANQGGYHAFLSSQNSTTLATANGTNPRIDIICATCGDSSYTLPSGGTSGQVTIQGVTGTPTAGASLSNLSGAPTLPLSSLLLGYVLVPASATSLTGVDIANKATQVALQSVTAGNLLASKSYNPGTQSTYAFGSSTWTYPDTTNLAITATVPPSGRVIIQGAGGQIQANGTASITSGVNTASSGTPTWAQSIGTATNTSSSGDGMINMPYQVDALLTGLTPSASVTFYLAIYCGGTNGDLYVGGTTSNAFILTASAA